MNTAPVTFDGIAEKAIADSATGDLIIEGWAARYDEPDRQREFFMPGAFARTWDKFKAAGAPLLWHHDGSKQLGQVLELTEKAEGVWAKALIPRPSEQWALDIYEKVRRGMTKGLSAKGMFTKQRLPGGVARVADVDLYELSVTPVPIGSTATIVAVAQKAFDGELGGPEHDQIDLFTAYLDKRLAAVAVDLAKIEKACHTAR